MAEAVRIDRTDTIVIVVNEYPRVEEAVKRIFELKHAIEKEEATIIPDKAKIQAWKVERSECLKTATDVLTRELRDLVLHNELKIESWGQRGLVYTADIYIVYKKKDLRDRATEAEAGVLGGN